MDVIRHFEASNVAVKRLTVSCPSVYGAREIADPRRCVLRRPKASSVGAWLQRRRDQPSEGSPLMMIKASFPILTANSSS